MVLIHLLLGCPPSVCLTPTSGNVAEGVWGGSSELAVYAEADGTAVAYLNCASANIDDATVEHGRIDWHFDIYNEDSGTTPTGPDSSGRLEAHVCGDRMQGELTQGERTVSVALERGARPRVVGCD